MSQSILDARSFRSFFIAGARRLDEGREYLNSINVFPVPDGDTGSNMADTMTNAAVILDGDLHADAALPHLLGELDTALRMEARGNSGIILSEFFHALFGRLKEETVISGAPFVEAFSAARQAAYAALAQPEEGTILTVIRKMDDRLRDMETGSISHLLAGAVATGKEALEHTPEEMPLLKENGVVDSGAYGFILFWEGGLAWLKGEYSHVDLKPVKRVFKQERSGSITYRFCTEGLVRPSAPVDLAALRADLVPLGDSLIVTGDAALVKVHIHSNEPEKVWERMAGLGEMVKTKAEDMIAQNKARTKSVARQKVRIVTDSTCDLDLPTRESLRVSMASLTLTLGDESFLDGVELSTDEFYRRMELFNGVPRTSLPPGKEFMNAYKEAAEGGESILGVYLASSLSGTWQAGKKWGEEFGEVTAFDSCTTSLGLGMMVTEAARMAADGAELEAIITRLETMRKKMKTYLTVDTLEHLARSGRIGQAKRLIGQALSLKPIMTLEEGEVVPVAKGFGRNGMVTQLVRLAQERAARPDFEGKVAVIHVGAEEVARRLVTRLTSALGIDDIQTGLASPVIGAHVGPGALGMFLC